MSKRKKIVDKLNVKVVRIRIMVINQDMDKVQAKLLRDDARKRRLSRPDRHSLKQTRPRRLRKPKRKLRRLLRLKLLQRRKKKKPQLEAVVMTPPEPKVVAEAKVNLKVEAKVRPKARSCQERASPAALSAKGKSCR